MCSRHSFNGKPQATVFYWLADACGLPLNEKTSAPVVNAQYEVCLNEGSGHHAHRRTQGNQE